MKKLVTLIIFTLFSVCNSINLVYAKPLLKKDGDSLLIDFGEQAEQGWIKSDSKTKYTPETGFGWTMTSFIESQTLSGNGVLSDAIAIKRDCETKTEFKIDVAPGVYDISVYSGDIRFMTVGFEGHPAIINLEYPASEARVQIPVTDGLLNMSLLRGSSGMDLSIAAMTVKKVSSLQERKKRIFICGDSTAATFYPLFMYQPLEDGYRGGWGQMLSVYLNDSVYVHNMSSQGQTAKGFIESGRLKSTLFFMQEGDYAFISLGINDVNAYTENEYISYMSQIIEAIQDKGGIPVIISSPPYLYDFDGNGIYNGSDRCYRNCAKEIADKYSLCYIDLSNLSSSFYNHIGPEQLTHMYWTTWSGTKDNIHLSRNGAGQLARLITEECAKNGFDFVSESTASSIGAGNNDIRCKTYKNNIYLQNILPFDKEVMFITNSHRGGKLVSSNSFTSALPAFDVLEPYKVTELYMPLYDTSKHIFMMSENVSLPLKWLVE